MITCVGGKGRDEVVSSIIIGKRVTMKKGRQWFIFYMHDILERTFHRRAWRLGFGVNQEQHNTSY